MSAIEKLIGVAVFHEESSNLSETIIEVHGNNGSFQVTCTDVHELVRELESLRAERDRYRNALAQQVMPDRYTTMEPCPFCNERDSRYKYETPHTDDCVWVEAVQPEEDRA